MSTDTICIAVVGTKHIPKAFRDQAIIDIGMEQQLQSNRKVTSTFIVAAKDQDNNQPYQPSKPSQSIPFRKSLQSVYKHSGPPSLRALKPPGASAGFAKR